MDAAAPIRITSSTPSIYETLRRVNQGVLNLNPDFQRNFIWDAVRQSRLVESVLLQIPLPVFYVDASAEESREVVDGLQRLSSLAAFAGDRLSLCGLQIMPELNGCRFSQLPEPLQRRFEDTQLTVFTIEPETPRDVKFQIFQRVNTGGINLNNQEIRHAVYAGPARDWLRATAELDELRRLIDGQVDVGRMEDRECVLRFVCFWLNPYSSLDSDDEISDIESLMNRTMQELNDTTPMRRTQYTEILCSGLQRVQRVFGDLACREVREQQETGPFRKELFDVWTVLLARVSDNAVARHTAQLAKAAIEVMTTDAAFSAAIQPGANTAQQIITRFGTIDRLLQQIIR